LIYDSLDGWKKDSVRRQSGRPDVTFFPGFSTALAAAIILTMKKRNDLGLLS
jgi:hypothetical protein